MSEVNLVCDSTAFLEVCVSKLVERLLRECASVCENVMEIEKRDGKRGEIYGEQQYWQEGALMN
jgi:hypothetical protein